MNKHHKLARDDLPNFPDNIFEGWMDEYISAEGWPPHADPTQIPCNRWKRLLLQRPVSFWQGVEWENCGIDFNLSLLAFADASNLLALEQAVRSEHPSTQYPPDSRDRVAYHLNSLEKDNQLCAPVIFLRNSGDLEILDGFHRLVALVIHHKMRQMNPYPSVSLNVWMGTN